MKIYTDEIVEIPDSNTYLYDKFTREPEVDNLIRVITNLSQPCTIAVNGDWGTGKSTFLRFLQAELIKKNIKASYFNAWEKDFDRDPFLLIINHIVSNFSKSKRKSDELKRISIKLFKLMTINSAKAATGYFLPPAADIIENVTTEALDNLIKEETEVNRLQKKLESLTNDSNKIVVLIDELDRCKPIFSIELLERIKHIFNTPNIIFVLGTDLEQLSRAISGVYGESYDGKKYLERFFDIEMNLSTPNYEDYWQMLVSNYSGHNEIKSMNNKQYILEYGLWFSNHMMLSARDAKKLYNYFYLAALANHEESNLPITLLLIIIKRYSNELYSEINKKIININVLTKIIEEFSLVKFSPEDLTKNDKILLKIFVLIHNLFLSKDCGYDSDFLINKFNEYIHHDFSKKLIEDFIKENAHMNEFSIKDINLAYNAVNMQNISYNHYITQASSISTSYGQARIVSSSN